MKKLLIILLFVFWAGCVEDGESNNNQGSADGNIIHKRELVQTAEEMITDEANNVSPNQEGEPGSQSEPQLEVQETVSYNPENVVKLAIAKCKEAGMVTTEEHLRDNLNAGRITQEEYDEYYPLDGLEESYYGVFVRAEMSLMSI